MKTYVQFFESDPRVSRLSTFTSFDISELNQVLFLRPVPCTLCLVIFYQVGQRDNTLKMLLLNHAPEDLTVVLIDP